MAVTFSHRGLEPVFRRVKVEAGPIREGIWEK